MLLALLACVSADRPGDAPPPIPADSPDPRSPTALPPASTRSALPADALPESDLPFAGAGRWELDGHVLVLSRTLLSADGEPILTGVYDDPIASGDTLWVPADTGDGAGAIYVVRPADGAVQVAALVTGGRPDRLVLAPDGETLVYVAGTTGITSLWRVATAGGPPRQLTNVGIGRPLVPGTAPAGFVPPPVGAPPRFTGDHLVWTVASRDWEVAWR